MRTDDKVRSYPTAMSRAVGLVAVALIFTFFGARALQESWAVENHASLIAFPVAAGLVALSKSFNVSVHFRAPKDEREKRFVRALSTLNGIGAVGTLISVVLLLVISSGDFLVSFVLPLCIFLISLVLQGVSAVLYRPFVVWDVNSD